MTKRDARETNGRSDHAPTVIEQAELHPAAARELAAARLALNIGWALNAAVRARGWQAKRLAKELGIGDSAVSQVLNGDGNLRVATIGRYARALGYQPKIVLEPVEDGLVPITEPAPRRRAVSGRSASTRRVALPDTGWRVFKTADGGVWAAETTTSDRGPDRVVQETAYTRLVPASAPKVLSSDASLIAGGSA